MSKRKDSKGRVLKPGEYEERPGYYRFKLTDEHGKRHSISASSLEELREKEKKLDNELYKGIDRNSSPTLLKQIEFSLSLRKGLKESSQKNYNFWLQGIRDDWLLKMKIADIKSSHIKQWMIEKEKAGKSQSYISGIVSGLFKPAFDQAIEDELLNRSPCTFKITDVVNIPKKKQRDLTFEEEAALREYLDQDRTICFNNRDFIILILETGLRISELCALTKDDVDLENHTLHVNKQLCKEVGSVRIDTTKSETGDRHIPLSPEAENRLAHAMTNPANFDYTIDGVSGFIFHGRDGQPLNRDTARRRYDQIKVLVDEQYGTNLAETTLHSLRHTYSTRLMDGGVKPKSVQYLMGHKNLSTTYDIYVHNNIKLIKEELRKFNKSKKESEDKLRTD